MDADRRKRLRELFDGPRFKGDTQKFIKDSGYSKGRVSQFFDDDQAFGERSARTLAERLKLPLNYFELSDESPIKAFDEDTLEHAALYQRLSPTERSKLRLLYQVAREGRHPEKIKSALTGRDASEPVDMMLGGDSGLGGLDEATEDEPSKGKQ